MLGLWSWPAIGLCATDTTSSRPAVGDPELASDLLALVAGRASARRVAVGADGAGHHDGAGFVDATLEQQVALVGSEHAGDLRPDQRRVERMAVAPDCRGR